MPVETDTNGRYTAAVPDSKVSVGAWSRADLQPCLSAADVRRDTTLDVHVVPETQAQSPAARDLRSELPLITGQVYETTAAGPRPLPGAAILVDILMEVYHGFTRTDELGRFFLCRINSPIRIEVSLEGYRWVAREVRGSADVRVDIELTR